MAYWRRPDLETRYINAIRDVAPWHTTLPGKRDALIPSLVFAREPGRITNPSVPGGHATGSRPLPLVQHHGQAPGK
jgi:hypothetical protein